LRAGDENGDAIGEAHDHRAGEVFDGRAESGDAEQHKNDAGHHRASEEAIDAVLGDDACHHHNESTGRSSDLRF